MEGGQIGKGSFRNGISGLLKSETPHKIKLLTICFYYPMCHPNPLSTKLTFTTCQNIKFEKNSAMLEGFRHVAGPLCGKP